MSHLQEGVKPCISAVDCSPFSSSSSSSYSSSADRLTVADINSLLPRVDYRDGVWSFKADERSGHVRVRLMATVADSRNPAGTVDLGIDAWPPADAFNDEPAFLQWLLGRLIEHEVHEAREWLRCDGQLVDDPHGAFG